MNTENQIEIYQATDGSTQINVQFEQDTVWLTQAQMAELFGKGRTTITEHINNVFTEGEFLEEVVCRDFRHTTQHGAIKGKKMILSTNAKTTQVRKFNSILFHTIDKLKKNRYLRCIL